MSSAEAEDLIARLSGGLHPADRDAFRREAEAAINAPGECWGPGLVHRTVATVWRKFFRPPTDDDIQTWERAKHASDRLLRARTR